jgi:hypothetical protein
MTSYVSICVSKRCLRVKQALPRNDVICFNFREQEMYPRETGFTSKLRNMFQFLCTRDFSVRNRLHLEMTSYVSICVSKRCLRVKQASPRNDVICFNFVCKRCFRVKQALPRNDVICFNFVCKRCFRVKQALPRN